MNRQSILLGAMFVLIASFALSRGAIAADCIEYNEYLRWIGGGSSVGDPSNIALIGDIAYLAASDSGMVVMDISNSNEPTVITVADTLGWVHSVATSDDHLFVLHTGSQYTDTGEALTIFDISGPLDLDYVATILIPGSWPNDVVVEGGYAYVGMQDQIQVVDVSVPANPILAGEVGTLGFVLSMAIDSNLLVAASVGAESHVEVFSIDSPTAPQTRGSVETLDWAWDVAVVGSYAYVADDPMDCRLWIYRTRIYRLS